MNMVQFNWVNKKAYLFSILSLFATMYSYSDLKDTYFGNHSISVSANIVFGIIYLIFYYCYYRFLINKICNFSVQSKFIGIFAGIVNVLGRNYMLHNSMLFFSKNSLFAVCFSLLAAIGYGLLYASVFELGWYYLKVVGEKELEVNDKSSFANTISHFVFEKRPLLYPFLIICLCWAPYLVSFFPGALQWDAIITLFGYYGITEWNNQHPVIGALLMGYIMDFGKLLGSDNYGCAIYVILQFLLLSVTLAYNFVFFNKWKTSYIFRWVVLFIFSLHPVFPTFVMTEVKDVFYYVAFLWLLFLFIKCYDDYNKLLGLYIAVASMFVCALRKEGLLLCILCAMLLLFRQEKIYKEWKSIVNAILTGSIFAMILSCGALLHYNVERSSVKEAFSIPFQQTARYIRDYSEDITESEWKILNAFFQNKANKIGGYYAPDIADPVREQIDNHKFRVQMPAYFKVWGSLFLKHPDCYFSAAFNQMYGYFYIGKEAMYKIGDCRTENFVKGDNLYHEKLKVVDDPRTIALRKYMKEYVYTWPELPVLGLLYHPAVYTWILIFGLSCLIRLKEYKYLFLYCLPLAALCICCLSPANAFIRFSYPVIISCFVLLAYNLRLVSCINR